MVNKSLSSLLCLSPSLNVLDAAFLADRSVSFPVHFEMSSDGVGGRTIQFHAHSQHLQNFTYVSDPILYPFPEENHLQKFFTDERNLVLEVDGYFVCAFECHFIVYMKFTKF